MFLIYFLVLLFTSGWAAVVANLEDSVSVFRNQGEVFEQSYQQHLESRSQYVELLEK